MAIYLSQHGKSASKEIDPRRGLTREGAAEVTRVARTIADAGIALDIIWHSGKARASQTADIFAGLLNPKEGVSSRTGIDPLDDVETLADTLPTERDELFVGHLPFMERIISYLVAGDPDVRVVMFQNGGVVRLDWDGEAQRWVIRWTVFPNL
jgi:phosphohistidine phosphatase